MQWKRHRLLVLEEKPKLGKISQDMIREKNNKIKGITNKRWSVTSKMYFVVVK